MGNVEVAGAKIAGNLQVLPKKMLPTKLHFFGLRREKKFGICLFLQNKLRIPPL